MNIVSKMSQQTIVNAFEINSLTKNKKGNNFVTYIGGEIILFQFFSCFTTHKGIDMKSIAFWDQIHEHYTQNQHACGVELPTKSRETKWGVIKHDVAKFIGHYGIVVALYEFGTLVENILQKTLELYKSKHIKI